MVERTSRMPMFFAFFSASLFAAPARAGEPTPPEARAIRAELDAFARETRRPIKRWRRKGSKAIFADSEPSWVVRQGLRAAYIATAA